MGFRGLNIAENSENSNLMSFLQVKHFLLMTQAFIFITEKAFAENLLKMTPNLSNLAQVSTFINFNETLEFFSLCSNKNI